MTTRHNEPLGIARLDQLGETEKLLRPRLKTHRQAHKVGILGGGRNGYDVRGGIEGDQARFVSGGQERRREVANG